MRKAGASRASTAGRGWVTAGFIAPAFVLYTAFIVYPLATALEYSFLRWQGTARGEFVGWGKDSRTIAWGFTLQEKQPPVTALAAGAFWLRRE